MPGDAAGGVDDHEEVREGLAAAIGGVGRGAAAADQLCTSFVDLLDVDGAALAVVVSEDVVSRSLGTSGPLSNELMELQFMLGEGPCLHSMSQAEPVLAANLHGKESETWPVFAGAASRLGVAAVFALPVAVAGFPIGALFLHRNRAGPLEGADLVGAFFAADLAALPILDVMSLVLHATVEDAAGDSWAELAALARSEVYQAAGVLIAQLGLTPAEALVRLRGHAFAHGQTTSAAAYDILERRVLLDDDSPGDERRDH